MNQDKPVESDVDTRLKGKAQVMARLIEIIRNPTQHLPVLPLSVRGGKTQAMLQQLRGTHRNRIHIQGPTNGVRNFQIQGLNSALWAHGLIHEDQDNIRQDAPRVIDYISILRQETAVQTPAAERDRMLRILSEFRSNDMFVRSERPSTHFLRPDAGGELSMNAHRSRGGEFQPTPHTWQVTLDFENVRMRGAELSTTRGLGRPANADPDIDRRYDSYIAPPLHPDEPKEISPIVFESDVFVVREIMCRADAIIYGRSQWCTANNTYSYNYSYSHQHGRMWVFSRRDKSRPQFQLFRRYVSGALSLYNGGNVPVPLTTLTELDSSTEFQAWLGRNGIQQKQNTGHTQTRRSMYEFMEEWVRAIRIPGQRAGLSAHMERNERPLIVAPSREMLAVFPISFEQDAGGFGRYSRAVREHRNNDIEFEFVGIKSRRMPMAEQKQPFYLHKQGPAGWWDKRAEPREKVRPSKLASSVLGRLTAREYLK